MSQSEGLRTSVNASPKLLLRGNEYLLLRLHGKFFQGTSSRVRPLLQPAIVAASRFGKFTIKSTAARCPQSFANTGEKKKRGKPQVVGGKKHYLFCTLYWRPDLRGEEGRGESMPTDQEPTFTVKLLQLILISTYWGMQIWVTFVSSFVMNNHLNRHTYGFIQSRLVPFYLHLGSACAFFNLAIYAVYHPSDMLDDREAFQIFIFFVSVTVSAVNAQWFGQMTSEIMADMHLIEQACGLGQDIGLSSNREAYAKLCETDVKYRHLSSRLWLYRLLSSLCNLCCIGCNFYSLCYMAENLVAL